MAKYVRVEIILTEVEIEEGDYETADKKMDEGEGEAVGWLQFDATDDLMSEVDNIIAEVKDMLIGWE